ncbi:FecR family protein [Sphingomonas mollis]|uniref:FecR domain-containing protein n=1 Tax=Sphingomonas mollis TaxID=2795726 RepID=A0ABS0XL00_9SPHN|nr:FecR domain-containing protein [Sphingomonas sp. BT553]MBJ6120393.1 FecR domain-containing protein [Sphingomonas sp. BT553]
MSEDRNDVASGPVGIDDEALDWVIQMAEPQADWDAYLAWLEADPTRAERYDRAASALQDAAIAVARLPVSPPATAAHPDTADAGGDPTGWTRRRWLGGAVAAALVGAIGLGVWTGRSDPYIVATAAGEQRTVDLGDGSSIVLAGASEVRLDHKAPRVAAVERGEALFRVRHDPGRPFDVRVGDLALTDLGTVFDVQRLGRRTRVSVAEGAVMVDPDGAALRLDPGQAVIADGAVLERQSIDAVDVGGWRDGRLAYDDATLAEVAEDLSRQLAMRIATAPSVAGRKFRGTLEIGSLRNDPTLLGELLGVSVRRTGGGWMLEPRR